MRFLEHFKYWNKLNALALVRNVVTKYELFLGTTCDCVYIDLLFVDFSLRRELSFVGESGGLDGSFLFIL